MFKLSEFACRCGRRDCDAPQMSQVFLNKINQLREIWGKPLIVTSGARCSFWNREVGGEPGSQHLLGIASDLLVNKKDRKKFLEVAEKVGFTGVGVYEHFIHLDIGPARRWGLKTPS